LDSWGSRLAALRLATTRNSSSSRQQHIATEHDTMVFLTMVDIWRETVEELGGLRGFFYIFIVMVVFTLIVQWAVGRASATRAAKRMNRQRMRKLR